MLRVIIPKNRIRHKRTKAFNNNPNLHNLKVYGIVDRDYRSDYEIEKLRENNIFILRVAEVENLFITEELVKLFAEHMGKDKEEVFKEIQKYVIDIRYANQIKCGIPEKYNSEFDKTIILRNNLEQQIEGCRDN